MKKKIQSILAFIKNNAANIILGVVILYIVNAIIRIVKDDGTKNGEKYYEDFAVEADSLGIDNDDKEE